LSLASLLCMYEIILLSKKKFFWQYVVIVKEK
jgi:hypothetical protein